MTDQIGRNVDKAASACAELLPQSIDCGGSKEYPQLLLDAIAGVVPFDVAILSPI